MMREKTATEASDMVLVRSSHGRSRARVTHAVVVIFLEFFAWGLLTTPMLAVLHDMFPQHTFLMNGLVQGVKGFLSFLSAPLIGALSDIWGRKSFLLMTVFFTCAPIPFMKISPWVRSKVGYVLTLPPLPRQVSATFAASLVTSPAIGAYLSAQYGDSLVVLVATVIAVADIAFVFFVVPESLPDKMRLTSWGFPISWEQADPFASLRRVGKDTTVLLICVTVFLSYLPEAGQYSSFFLYLRQVTHRQLPALYGFIFFLFNVELNEVEPMAGRSTASTQKLVVPGPPFLFGACSVIFALVVAFFIPERHQLAEVKTCTANKAGSSSAAHAQNGSPLAVPISDTEDLEPLLQDSVM
ncbi:hippocampus abundant transcript-like protein 1 [Neolamprologus brichardi]|uniref:hippocampus abundant transcript-like protein 1 n=1 Tax=Neolamprologus brichardi TaxID=32507 RepID=UPI00164391C9|nr:hippocampus abundant transcript-like protein 1 [Neolamprologus brichardi]